VNGDSVACEANEVLVSAICKDVAAPPQLQGGRAHGPGASGIVGLCVGK
jgi:hypothetical protein